MVAEVDVCSSTDEMVCVDISFGWSDIDIKLAATYRLVSNGDA